MTRFYVYQLIDPRCNLPFYIGKGKGKRIDAHEGEARKGVSSPKCDKINEIWAAGLKIEKEILREFEEEKEAFRFEAEMISRIGRENLTNFGKVYETPERKYFHLARFINTWLRIYHGLRKPPHSSLRFTTAMFRCLQRRDPTPFIQTWADRIGFDLLQRLMTPHNVRLGNGG